MNRPCFRCEDDEYLFFHRLWEQCQDNECSLCAQVKDIVVYAVGNLLMKCIHIESDSVLGCDLASLYSIKMTYAAARDILSGTGDKHLKIIYKHFAHLTEKLSENETKILQLVRVGGLQIFCALLNFFETFINKRDGHEDSDLRINFLLLCFHINGLFYMSTNAVRNLWAETLREDATLILLRGNCDKELNFGKVLKQLRDDFL